MWMYFNSEKAYDFLKENGDIYTLRAVGKRSPAEEVKVDIRHRSRETRFKAVRVFVRQVMLNGPYDEILRKYVPKSGFGSLEEWKAEALRLSGENEWWNLFEVVVVN